MLIYKCAVGETLRVSRRARARPMKRTCLFSLKNKCVFSLKNNCVFSLNYISLYSVRPNSSIHKAPP